MKRFHVIVKSFFILFSSLLLTNNGKAQNYGTPVEVSNALYSPRELSMVDFDGDGDDDMVYADGPFDFDNGDTGFIYWRENLGEGEFGERQVLSDGHFYIRYLKVVDLDNDGDMDMVYTYSTSLMFLENTGENDFEEARVLVPGAGAFFYFDFVDFDEDGDLDIISRTGLQIIRISYNNGNAEFIEAAAVTEFDNTFNEVRGLGALDVNEDGLKDVVVFLNQTGFGWYENLGDSLFAEFELIEIISTEEIGAFQANKIFVEDLNGDDIEDIIIILDEGWFYLRNSPGGLFEPSQNFLSTSVSDNYPWIGNFDDDELQDVMITRRGGFGHYPGPHIYRFSYQVDGLYAVDSLNLNRGGIDDIALSDYDMDNDMDIVIISSSGKTIGLLENEDNDFPQDYEEIGEGLGYILSVHGVDMNGDLREDIVVSSERDDKIAWYQQNPDGSFSDQKLISRGLAQIKQILPFDMDADGDQDILLSHRSELPKDFWFENDGQGGGWQQHEVIKMNYTILESVDLDNDGILEIINFTRGDFIVYKVNDSGDLEEYFQFDEDLPYSLITPGFDVADLDDDGDIDLAAQIRFGNEGYHIGWYENNGDAEFSAMDTILQINNTQAGDLSLVVDDFDSDGLPDFVFMGIIEPSENVQVYLLKNLGEGEFAEPIPLIADINFPGTFSAADTDSDGDLDIIVSKFDSNGSWYLSPLSPFSLEYRNDGNGNFTGPWYLNTKVGLFLASDVVDFEMDSDDDLVLASARKSNITYLKNFHFSPVRASGTVYIDENQNGIRDSSEIFPDWLFVSSDPEGSFTFLSDSGRYVISYPDIEQTYNLVPDLPLNWIVTTDSLSYTISFNSDTTFIDSLDFGIYPLFEIPDLEVSLTGGNHRCNSKVQFWIHIMNEGPPVDSAIIEVELDDLTELSNVQVPPDSVNGNLIYWSMEDLDYFENFDLYFSLDIPGEDLIGEEIITSLRVFKYDANDDEYLIGTDSVTDVISCSYDPNDKQVSPDSETIPLGQELEYLIRFQNTGTDTAFTVVLSDELSQNLNLNSFQPGASSHSYDYLLDETGLLLFTFENILLPDSGADYAGSQGFVKFRIQANEELEPNTLIQNEAGIYFDLNSAIITNTVESIIECYIAPTPLITFDGFALQAGDVGQSYQWYLNGGLIEGADAESWIPEENGLYTVEITDENGCSTLSPAFNYDPLNTEETNFGDIFIYPNPSSDLIYFDLSSLGNQPLQLSVYDLSGKRIFTDSHLGGSVYSLSKTELESGVFVLSVSDPSSEEVLTTGRFVIR
jgi:uncharacterized repeat protein (TIGR01451 family)